MRLALALILYIPVDCISEWLLVDTKFHRSGLSDGVFLPDFLPGEASAELATCSIGPWLDSK